MSTRHIQLGNWRVLEFFHEKNVKIKIKIEKASRSSCGKHARIIVHFREAIFRHYSVMNKDVLAHVFLKNENLWNYQQNWSNYIFYSFFIVPFIYTVAGKKISLLLNNHNWESTRPNSTHKMCFKTPLSRLKEWNRFRSHQPGHFISLASLDIPSQKAISRMFLKSANKFENSTNIDKQLQWI